ncbi:MAG: hypothetical protein WA418_31395 [Bradyrhizobium sp.]
MELSDGLVVIGAIVGWPLRRFRSWLDRQPDRDPSQSTTHRLLRLALGFGLDMPILGPLV